MAKVISRARRPFCADCGGADCHVVSVREMYVNGEGEEFETTYHVWLCGSCEMLRQNPDAPKVEKPPGLPSTWPKGRGKPQKEKLF